MLYNADLATYFACLFHSGILQMLCYNGTACLEGQATSNQEMQMFFLPENRNQENSAILVLFHTTN